MKYLSSQPFSLPPASDDYRNNYDAIFGKKDNVKKPTKKPVKKPTVKTTRDKAKSGKSV